MRCPIKAEKLVGVPFGAGLGFLYSVTTISGPPLALLFNNQGCVKQDFRAGLAVIRVAESTLTAIVYYHLGTVHRADPGARSRPSCSACWSAFRSAPSPSASSTPRPSAASA